MSHENQELGLYWRTWLLVVCSESTTLQYMYYPFACLIYVITGYVAASQSDCIRLYIKEAQNSNISVRSLGSNGPFSAGNHAITRGFVR